mgnify:CR=1 FL=1
MDSIYLDDEGLKLYKESIDNLIKNVDMVNDEISRLRDDLKHDNIDKINELYDLRDQMIRKIEDKKNTLTLVKIIEKENSENILNLGDVATIELDFGEDDKETCLIKLVSVESYTENDLECVSINSPLGRALYRKNVGEKTHYMVKNNKIEVTILKKNNKVLKKTQ